MKFIDIVIKIIIVVLLGLFLYFYFFSKNIEWDYNNLLQENDSLKIEYLNLQDSLIRYEQKDDSLQDVIIDMDSAFWEKYYQDSLYWAKLIQDSIQTIQDMNSYEKSKYFLMRTSKDTNPEPVLIYYDDSSLVVPLTNIDSANLNFVYLASCRMEVTLLQNEIHHLEARSDQLVQRIIYKDNQIKILKEQTDNLANQNQNQNQIIEEQGEQIKKYDKHRKIAAAGVLLFGIIAILK